MVLSLLHELVSRRHTYVCTHSRPLPHGPHARVRRAARGSACLLTIFSWLFWMLLLVIIVTAVWSAFFLNKAMMYYGNTEARQQIVADHT